MATAFPGGHPPGWFVLGEGVILVSFVIAPIGAIAASIDIWRACRRHESRSRLTVPALGMNLLFLVVAVGLWFWIQWEATRR